MRLAILAILTLGPSQRPVSFTFHHENILGAPLSLEIHATSADDAQKAEAAALTEMDRLDAILSSYRPDSEFSRWTRTKTPMPVSAELYAVLEAWDHWRLETGGALNPAFAAAGAGRIDGPQWQLNPAHRTAKRLGDAPLRLNSFTKSWVLGRAARAAQQAAPLAAIAINGGGDIIVRGERPIEVQLRDPRATADNSEPLIRRSLQDRAIATSGDYFKPGHLIDARTGRPATHVASATVVAQDEATAGALATAFTILTPDESEALATRYPGVEYLILARDGHTYCRSLCPDALAPRLVMGAAFAPAPAPKKMTVQFELARADSGRYRRPYVAVWLEDADHFPVRTIALWYERPRWLPDLKAWSRADRLRHMAEGTEIAATIASATRPPGKYAVEWDGKDQAGKPVKPGKYTLFLEAAREHGTYQLMRQDIDLAAGPAQFKLGPNPEIAGATIEIK